MKSFFSLNTPWGQHAPVPQVPTGLGHPVCSTQQSSKTALPSSSESTEVRCLAFGESVRQSSDHAGVACINAEDLSYKANVDFCDLSKQAGVNSRKGQLELEHDLDLGCNYKRLILTPPGTDVTKFPSTRVLVQVMRDVVRAHELVLEYGVSYHNISPGRVMVGSNLRGYLFDFDHSPQVYAEDNKIDEGGFREEADKELKEPTGPRQFMPMDFLDLGRRGLKGPYHHLSRHYLESFFWLYIWIIFRHINFEDEGGPTAASLFDQFNDYGALSMKMLFLGDGRPPTVVNNQPLTRLIADLVLIFKSHIPVGRAHAPDTNHQDILRTYDLALALPGWPDNDASILYNPPNPAIEVNLQEDRAASTLEERAEAERFAQDVQALANVDGGAKAPETEEPKVGDEPPVVPRRSRRIMDKSVRGTGKSVRGIGASRSHRSAARSGLHSGLSTRCSSRIAARSAPAMGPPEDVPPVGPSCPRNSYKRRRLN